MVTHSITQLYAMDNLELSSKALIQKEMTLHIMHQKRILRN